MSRGSVIPLFLQNKSNVYDVTDPNMTRFCITLEQSVQAASWVIKNSKGGEIFIPKSPSYKILDVIKAINKNAKIKIIGIRPGEKLFEELISSNDNENVYDQGKFFIITKNKMKKYKKTPKNFSYTSANNPNFFSVNELKAIISETKKDA